MTEQDPCSIEIPLPQGSDQQDIKSAISQALESRWTDLRTCDDHITISIKFQHP